MKILYLINIKYYKTKMSRIRFHTIRGISSYLKDHKLGELVMSGPGWVNWEEDLDCVENINKLYSNEKPDVVIGFKPLELPNFKDIEQTKCIRYNEMYDVEWTTKEIMEARPNLVICHHHNDYIEWSNKISDKVKLPWKFKFDWIPHSIDTNIFNPGEDTKRYDVAIMGAVNVQTILGDHYPLRARMVNIIKKMPPQYKCVVLPHVGGNHDDSFTDKYMYDFAQKLKSTRILVTCSGAPKSRFGKYLEAAACGVNVAADVYNDHPEDIIELKKFLIEINMDMTDDEIIKILVGYLENPELRQKKINKGLDYMKNYGVDNYAERFLKVVDILKAVEIFKMYICTEKCCLNKEKCTFEKKECGLLGHDRLAVCKEDKKVIVTTKKRIKDDKK